MTQVPSGWAIHYYDEPFKDLYFPHIYHYYEHGRSLCKRSIQRMPDQPHYADLPENHKEHGFCSWCMVQLIRGVHLPEHFWEDAMYETHKGKVYKVLDRNAAYKEKDGE